MNTTLPTQRFGNEPDLRRIGLHPNFWYPLAAADRLHKGKTLGVSFAGDPIVLVRSETNQVYALEDRCAHRQMPLRYGVVSGELLRCCYHGWSYNRHGRCIVPYLPRGAALPRGVRAYPTREAYGLIFVFPGETAAIDSVLFPELPNFHSRRHKTMFFSRQVKCHYSFVHENLMDMNHQFLHRRWMKKMRPVLIEARKGTGRVEVDYKFELVDGERIARRLMLGRRGGGADIVTVCTQYPYQTLRVRREGGSEPAIELWAACVPLDRAQRINHTFGFVTIRKPKIPALIHLFWPAIRYFAEAIFAEDRFALEAEQQAHDLQAADWNQEILPFILDLRQLLIASGVPIASPRAPFDAPAGSF